MLKKKLNSAIWKLRILKKIFIAYSYDDWADEVDYVIKLAESVPKMTLKKPELVESTINNIIEKSKDFDERINKDILDSYFKAETLNYKDFLK